MMLEKGGQSIWAKKDCFFWLLKPVQEVASPDFLPKLTAHGRQRSCGEVSSRANEKWTGDITAIWTYEGWLYLPVVLDLFSRRVIGWAMAATQDEALIETALRMALLGRQPSPGVLFHSDRGSQYTSDAYRAALAGADITVSMSRTGNCYDNAVTESFFGTLKGECVDRLSFQG